MVYTEELGATGCRTIEFVRLRGLEPKEGPAMSEQRLIRKYVNRRLYDTTQSRYVNLQDLRELITKGSQV